MSRLTDHKGHYCFMKCVEKQEDTEKIRENCPTYNVCFERKMYDKLWHYEDLEEAGKLIELPCAIRSRIYFIVENDEIDSMLIDNVQTALFFKDVNGNLKKGFYLTKEEAEAKLAELKGE